MKNCRKCGAETGGKAEICPNCGEPFALKDGQSVKEKVNVFLCILSALIPIVGLVFYLVWKKDRPRQSKISGICALVAFIAEMIAGIVMGFYAGYRVINGDWKIGGSNRPAPPDFVDKGDPEDPDDPQNPSEPKDPVYENSADGVLRFTYFSNYLYTCYDGATDSVVAWCGRKIAVYGRENGTEKFSETYLKNISCSSAYNGTLCVGFGGEAKQIAVVDLATGESRIENVNIAVEEIAVTDGLAVFCEGDQWCQVAVMDLNDFSVNYLSLSIYQPKIAINHDDKMLYAVETGLSSCAFIYLDLVTMEYSEKSEFGEYVYNEENVIFDGEYVHAFGYTFHARTGRKEAKRGCAEAVNVKGLKPTKTLCRNENYSLISEYDNRTIVYNNQTNEVVYVMNLAATEIYHVGGDIYVALCGDSGYVGYIDLSKI